MEQASVKPLRLPPRSPNLTPHIERFMRTIKEECLGRMIIFGERQLRKAIHEFSLHYHHERNHQGLGNKLIQPDEEICRQEGEFRCREPADCCVTTIAKPHKNSVRVVQRMTWKRRSGWRIASREPGVDR